MRKILAVLLSALMILSIASFGTFAADAQEISTADQFKAMAADGNYKLTADITITESYAENFIGILDGNGHKITITNCPVFKELSGNVKNLTIEGADVTADADFGALAAFAPEDGAVIENCINNVNITVTGDGLAAAGFIAQSQVLVTVVFLNCTNNGNITLNGVTPVVLEDGAAETECWAGGLGAHIDTGVAHNCVNNGDIKSTSQWNTVPGASVGGIFGRCAFTASLNYCDATFCVNNGDVYGTRDGAGIIGYAGLGSNYNSPEYGVYPFTVYGCENYGTITGHRYAGGMVGYFYTTGSNSNETFDIEFNINHGSIKGGNWQSYKDANSAGWCSDIISYSNSIFNVLKYNIGAGECSYHGEDHTSAPNKTFLGCSSANYENDPEFHDNYLADGGYYEWTTYASSSSNEACRHEFDWGEGENYVTRITADNLITGEIAVKINDAAQINGFYQTLGVDNTPTPFNTSKYVVADGNGYKNADKGTYADLAAHELVTTERTVATEAPTQAPTQAQDDPTEAPTQAGDQPTEAPTQAQDDPTQPAEDGGCGSVVACGLVLVAVLGTAYVAKKKF